jgi:mono/diheme cytochrome c family protein
MSNLLHYILLLFGITLVLASCNDSKPKPQNTSIQEAPKAEKINAQDLYIVKCVDCHGADGKLGVAGAKNLAETKLTVDEVKKQITNGKGAMPPFGNQLSEAEIRAIAEYVLIELKGK